MYNVVIVDDEVIIADGLRRMVPWEKYGCQVAGTAADGASGLALVRELLPDMLFTDIKMPEMDGLTMLSGLRSEFPDMQVTVLTGYRDIEFAQEAIKLGVTRFLLKPSKMEELEEAVGAMADKLQKIKPIDANADSDTASSFIVRQAVAYIEENSIAKITLTDVALHCYVSQWHLSKLLSRYAGQNFYDILNGARINKAKALLSDPSLRISDIAEMVGYADNAHFSRIFKKVVGMSANDYRKKN